MTSDAPATPITTAEAELQVRYDHYESLKALGLDEESPRVQFAIARFVSALRAYELLCDQEGTQAR